MEQGTQTKPTNNEETKKPIDYLALCQNNKLDIWTALIGLQSPSTGIVDLICNQLYNFPDDQIEFFIPQLCNRVLKDSKVRSLERFLLDKCASIHIGLKEYFWFQAAVEDNCFARQRCEELWQECEMATVNSKSRSSVRLSRFGEDENGAKKDGEQTLNESVLDSSIHTFSTMTQVNPLEQDSFLMQVVYRMKDPMEGVPRKDRSYLFKTYPNCFVGNEAVDWFLKQGFATSREEGVALGNRIFEHRIFEHVLQAHRFEDSYYFYRFLDPSQSLLASPSLLLQFKSIAKGHSKPSTPSHSRGNSVSMHSSNNNSSNSLNTLVSSNLILSNNDSPSVATTSVLPNSPPLLPTSSTITSVIASSSSDSHQVSQQEPTTSTTTLNSSTINSTQQQLLPSLIDPIPENQTKSSNPSNPPNPSNPSNPSNHISSSVLETVENNEIDLNPNGNNNNELNVDSNHSSTTSLTSSMTSSVIDVSHLRKKDRLYFFHNQLNFIKTITNLPFQLKEKVLTYGLTKSQLNFFLWEQLKKIQNEMIQPSTLLLEQFSKKHLQIIQQQIQFPPSLSSPSSIPSSLTSPLLSSSPLRSTMTSSLTSLSIPPSPAKAKRLSVLTSSIPSSSSSVPKEEIEQNQQIRYDHSTTSPSMMMEGIMEEDEDDEIDWNVIQHCSVYLPITSFSSSHQIIVRILPQESFCLNTRDRVPFMLFVETLCLENSVGNLLNNVENQIQNQFKIPTSRFEIALSKILQLNRDTLTEHAELPHSLQQRKPGDQQDWILLDNKTEEKKDSIIAVAFGESWKEREERIKKTSPFSFLPGWKIQSVIVKSGDDLRQEQLAIQLIHLFHNIFTESEIPLWLRPYSVVAVNSNCGFIETIPDAVSFDALKKRVPNFTNLEDYFVSAYGDKTSLSFLQAQRNFVEALAGYSLICYLLQIKDRHNGNILLMNDGHVVHIDYGFMLTSSPASLGFESAPFKLTTDYIKLMGGEQSDMFNYFKLLFLRGFLEVRKYYQRFLLTTELLLPGHKMGCFGRRETVVREFQDRFQLQLSESQCATFVNELIKECVGNWRTDSYDSYQYLVNGIL